METKSQKYRYVSTITLVMFLGVLFFAFFAYMSSITVNGSRWAIFFSVLTALSLYGAFSSIYSVTVTDEEIVAKWLLTNRALKWNDIHQIFPKSNGSFSLLNQDNDTKVFISSQFKGYIELVGFINQKRPDLFSFDHDNHFSRTIIRSVIVAITGLLIVGFLGLALYLIFIGEGSLLLNGNIILLAGLGIYILRSWSYSPQSFTLEGNTFIANYMYKKASYSADDISFIKLAANFGNLALMGYGYSVLLILKNKQLVKLSGFQQGPCAMYYVLLQWHQKYVEKQPNPST